MGDACTSVRREKSLLTVCMCYAAGTPCGIESHLPLVFCVSEIMPVAVLGRIDVCIELVMLSLMVRHRRHLFAKKIGKARGTELVH